jgi:hypothetical protein
VVNKETEGKMREGGGGLFRSWLSDQLGHKIPGGSDGMGGHSHSPLQLEVWLLSAARG